MAQPFKSSPNYLKSKKDHQLGIEPSVKLQKKKGNYPMIKSNRLMYWLGAFTILYYITKLRRMLQVK